MAKYADIVTLSDTFDELQGCPGAPEDPDDYPVDAISDEEMEPASRAAILFGCNHFFSLQTLASHLRQSRGLSCPICQMRLRTAESMQSSMPAPSDGSESSGSR